MMLDLKRYRNSILADLLCDSLKNNSIWIKIQGNSMSPYFKNGESVLINKAKRFLYGDILVYTQNGDIISHRLVRKRKDSFGNALYQTKPDNGYVLDEPRKFNDILGKVIAVKKENKVFYLDNFLSRIQALSICCISIIKILIYKYVKIRSKI